MERPKFIASCSFGKDSLAAILLAKEHGEPLDEDLLRSDVRQEYLRRGAGASGLHLRNRHSKAGGDGSQDHHPALEKDLCGSVHRTGHPRPQEGHGALLPRLRQMRCPAGLQGPAHPAVSENPAARNDPIYRLCAKVLKESSILQSAELL